MWTFTRHHTHTRWTSYTRLIPLTFDLCHIVDIALRLTNADGTDNHQSPDYCIAYHQLLFRPDALTRSCLPQTCCISCRSFTHLLTHSRHHSTSIGEFIPTCAHPRALCTRDPTDFTADICTVQQPYESTNTSTNSPTVFAADIETFCIAVMSAISKTFSPTSVLAVVPAF